MKSLIILSLIISGFTARAAFYECATKEPSSCVKELSKGQAIVRMAQDSGVIILKIDAVFLDQVSGSIKAVKKSKKNE